jgi:hypothetical protein
MHGTMNLKKGDIIYVYNPTRKVGQSSKFFSVWQGPYRVVARLSKLNYCVQSQQGKEFMVHINHMKRVYKQGIWKTKDRERCYGKQRTRRLEQEEDEQAVLGPRPVLIPVPQVDNHNLIPRTPDCSPQCDLDTPSTASQSTDARGESSSNICSS